jgi:hypothetical protein
VDFVFTYTGGLVLSLGEFRNVGLADVGAYAAILNARLSAMGPCAAYACSPAIAKAPVTDGLPFVSAGAHIDFARENIAAARRRSNSNSAASEP